MKRSISKLILVSAGMLLLSTGVQAQELKIAVLDVQAALFNSERAQEVDAEVRAETSADEQRVRELATQAQQLQQQLQQDASILSQDERRRLNNQIEEISVQYQYLVQKLQTTVQERQEAFQQATAPSLVQAISEVVEEEDFDLVLRAEAALHFRSSYDITARVTEKLNQL